ncbi:uncharacterized protein LOC110645316 [Hevea brasiliensis]|uniref:uncharacterized protein LOC110645316 n=1 Tax=Hevea brasiliensis TaxID=3981 RepID=UPI0025EDCC5A|nr:uncharacterized protein LOC110645316 [Hevea brasiliensis]
MDTGTSSTAIEDKSGNNRKRSSLEGGIYRAKQHLAGGHRNVTMCKRCPAHVREEIQDYMLKKVAAKDFDKTSFPDFEDVERMGDDEDEDEIGANIEVPQQRSNKVAYMRKKLRTKGPIDVFFTQNAERAVKDRKNAKLKQTTINEACKKELREKACRDIARWMYDAVIPFNAANYPSFQVILESVGQFGIGWKAPSYHELRIPLLNKEVTDVKNELKSYEEEWAKYGCSIMADGWTDKKQRTLINFLVNSPKGTIFLESVDTSDYSKTGEKMFELLDRIVERVGEANVVQVVTDNASNCVLARKLLQVKHPHLYWTPCAAHCLDLILEDIGKIPKFHNTIKRAVTMNGYIYVRPEEWTTSKWAKEQAGKKVTSIVMMPSFWSTMVYILKISGPLVRVLRLVDGEKRPAMGYIYEAMDRAKEAIAKSFIAADEEVMAAEWWNAYGASTLDLRNFTIKVLSLTCSASGCEHKWSIFEHYNRALRRRYDARHRIDPISLKDIDDSNEWLMGHMEEELENDELVFEDDNLTWNVVAEAIGHKGKPPSRADTPLLREETSSEEDEYIDFEEDEYEEDEVEGEDKEDLNATFDID